MSFVLFWAFFLLVDCTEKRGGTYVAPEILGICPCISVFWFSCICIFHFILFEIKSFKKKSDWPLLMCFIQSPSKLAFKSTTQNYSSLKFHLSNPPNPISPLLTSQNRLFIYCCCCRCFFLADGLLAMTSVPWVCALYFRKAFLFFCFFIPLTSRENLLQHFGSNRVGTYTTATKTKQIRRLFSRLFVSSLLLLRSGRIHLWRREIDRAVKPSGGLQV